MLGTYYLRKIEEVSVLIVIECGISTRTETKEYTNEKVAGSMIYPPVSIVLNTY